MKTTSFIFVPFLVLFILLNSFFAVFYFEKWQSSGIAQNVFDFIDDEGSLDQGFSENEKITQIAFEVEKVVLF